MKRINISDVQDNLIEAISKEWMLVTAGNKDHFNTMTANWGGVGYIWNKPVVFVFIRPERYTYEFMEANEFFTLSFLGEKHKDIHKICGSKSGRDIDKIKETGLIPLETETGNIIFDQSRMSFECRKLYADFLEKDHFIDPSIIDRWYTSHGNFHKMYIAEITNLYIS